MHEVVEAPRGKYESADKKCKRVEYEVEIPAVGAADGSDIDHEQDAENRAYGYKISFILGVEIFFQQQPKSSRIEMFTYFHY
jgi:hypothetical protein